LRGDGGGGGRLLVAEIVCAPFGFGPGDAVLADEEEPVLLYGLIDEGVVVLRLAFGVDDDVIVLL
jgi:hypothetical protein